jgi:hypothetical protein
MPVERMAAPAAPPLWTGSFRLHADRTTSSPAPARARAVPLAAQTVRSQTQWQNYGEPSNSGWPTLRGSCATTNIGARSDARPRLLSAVLENECANPTHDQVDAFRQIRPSRAIAQDLLVVRLRHVRAAWVAPNVRVPALVRVRSARLGDQASSGIDCRRKAAAIRGHESTRLAYALPNCVPSASSSSSLPAPLVWVARKEHGVDPQAFTR